MRKNTTNRRRAGRAIQKNQQAQTEDLLARLRELSEKYDISQQVFATGDVVGALSQVLDEAKAELDAIQSPVVGVMSATDTPDTISASVTVEGVQAHTGTGTLTMGGIRVSANVHVAGAKKISDVYADLPELHKRFIDYLLQAVIAYVAVKLSTQDPATININRYTNHYAVTQSAPAPRQRIMLCVNHPNLSMLRDAPTIDSDVIASMRTGDVVFWEQEQAEWTKVVYYETGGKRYIGWVLSADLTEYIPTRTDE